MITILLILNTMLPILFTAKKCISLDGICFNHKLLFSVGFWYYWIFPIVVGEHFQHITLSQWGNMYNEIEDKKIVWYLLITLIIYFAFIAAHFVHIGRRGRIKYYYSKKLYGIWIFISTTLFIYLALKNRIYLFKGYTLRDGDRSFVGTMSALLLTTFSFYALYSLENNKNSFIRNFKNKYVVFYLVSAVILIGFGGRLYIVSTLLALFVMCTSFYKRMKLGKGVLYGTIAFFVIGAIGLWRIDNEITYTGILNIISSESLYTSFSLLSYLGNYNFEIINFPIPLLSSIIDLIPRFFLRSKDNFIINVSDVGYSLYSPFGAQNSFVSFQINMGIVGTIFFIFALVIYLRMISVLTESNLSKVIYGCISAHLTFTFFRDPFDTSLIKNILEFSILIPVIVSVVNSAVSNSGKIIFMRK